MLTILASLLIAATAEQLPPQAAIDRHLLRTERMVVREDYEGARAELEVALQVQVDSDLPMPVEFHYWRGRVAVALGESDIALRVLNRYLSEAGRDGSLYREALEVYVLAEELVETRSTITARLCGRTGIDPEILGCWLEVARQPNCHVWRARYEADDIAEWSGTCVAGMAQGTGRLKLVRDGGNDVQEHDGRLVDGKQTGRSILRWSRGYGVFTEEGHYVDGRRHGRWVQRHPNGHIEEVLYENGRDTGEGVVRFLNGDVVPR